MQGGQLTPINLIVEERFHRAAPRGMGGTKAAGNYSPVSTLIPRLRARRPHLSSQSRCMVMPDDRLPHKRAG